jgi:hypothetical protein
VKAQLAGKLLAEAGLEFVGEAAVHIHFLLLIYPLP